MEDSLSKQLRGSHQKLLSMVGRLRELGYGTAVSHVQLKALLEDLPAQQQLHKQLLSEQRIQLRQWQRVQAQLDNMLEGRVTKN